MERLVWKLGRAAAFVVEHVAGRRRYRRMVANMAEAELQERLRLINNAVQNAMFDMEQEAGVMTDGQRAFANGMGRFEWRDW